MQCAIIEEKIRRCVLGIVVESVVIALVIATAMTACVYFAPLDPNSLGSSALQLVLLVLNFPAILFWMLGPAEHDRSGAVFRILVFLQWIMIGGGIGLLLAVVHRTSHWFTERFAAKRLHSSPDGRKHDARMD